VTAASLGGVRAKISRANLHLRNLKLSFRRRVASKKYADGVWLDHDSKRRALIGRARVSAPDLKWCLIVGDVVHNLRSSLDHLVFQLALLRNPSFKHERRTAFPIFNAESEFESKGIRRVKPYVCNEAFELVREYQPYHGATETQALLWILSELDNIDKHRMVVPLDKHFNIPNITLTSRLTKRKSRLASTRAQLFQPLKHGDKVFEVGYSESTEGPPEVDIDGLEMWIAFRGTEVCDGQNVIPLLRAVVRAVESVVDTFDANFFSKSLCRSECARGERDEGANKPRA